MFIIDILRGLLQSQVTPLPQDGLLSQVYFVLSILLLLFGGRLGAEAG